MYLDISSFSTISSSFSSTSSFVIVIVSPACSSASKEISSSTFSITVCNLLAPISSVFSLAFNEKEAKALIASSENSIFKSSTLNNAWYCLNKEFLVFVNILYKTSSFNDSNSTLKGNLPWSSGNKSLGFETWKAPAAINKIWSVEIVPYFVWTSLPSTIGSKSLWTPSFEGSWFCEDLEDAILSISSKNIIPPFLALFKASTFIASWSNNLSLAEDLNKFLASFIETSFLILSKTPKIQ